MVMINANEAFDNLNGKFLAKLKSLKIQRKTLEAKYEATYEAVSHTAIIEAKFDLSVFERLHSPTFVAIEMPLGDVKKYPIYEVVGINPVHYQMIGIGSNVPLQIREEFLSRVGESWGRSDETWIDITAVQTDYALVEENGKMKFERQRLVPLVGSRVHLLSIKTVKELLCVEGGIEIGKMFGFDIPLVVDPDSLIRYHVGVFGFTGVGKSNLTALLLRKLIKWDPNLKIVIFDVSGEYTVHLLDQLDKAHFYTTELFEDMESLVASQVVPESLEERVEDLKLREKFEKMKKEGRYGVLDLREKMTRLTLNDLYSFLNKIVEEGRAESVYAKRLLEEISSKLSSYPDDTPVLNLKGEDRDFLITKFSDVVGKVKYSLRTLLESLLSYLTSPPEEAELEGRVFPEDLAYKFLYDNNINILILYMPDPDQARIVASRFLDTLLYLKKKKGIRVKTLTVIDEAQEFIPRDARGTALDSNKSVEALLRQGRKYRSFAWISTQRVAHLNTNALQQLHSYFVSTLPRMYDRMVIADAFSLDYGLVEKVTELSTGEWLFVSYKATKQKNVPAFIRTENNEDYIVDYLKRS